MLIILYAIIAGSITDYISKYLFIWTQRRRGHGHEASRGAAARSVTVKPTGCGFDPHSRK